MRYNIVLTIEAKQDLAALKASDRAKVVNALDTHLRYEPEKVSKSRIKRLEGYDWPKYRLRIDHLRAFYDVVYSVDKGSGTVEVLVIREKNEAMKWLAEFRRRVEDEASSTERDER